MVEYDYSAMGKKGSKVRWNRVHSKVRISKKFSKEKVAIMAYISGDGYVGAREWCSHYDINIALDDASLVKRVVRLFRKEFNVFSQIKKIKPSVKDGSGYYTIRVSSKPVCLHLLSIGRYGGLNWKIPLGLSKNLLCEWIRCYFDCEAYVNSSKRQIQVKSVNGSGLKSLKSKLLSFGIHTKLYGPFDNGPNHNPYFMLCILHRDNLFMYQNKIGFYHSKKKVALQKFLKRYIS